MATLKNQSATFQISEVELVYRSKVKASNRPKVSSSREAYDILLQHWDSGKLELLEEFKVIFLSTANKVLGIYNASSGGVTGTVADPRLIFAAALKARATAMILVHNHPSGRLKPSHADTQLTDKLVKGGKFLDITVLDHLIISAEGYYSFADEGAL